MKIQMVDVLGQHRKIQEEMEQAVVEVLRSGAFINGPSVKEFRKNLASYLNVPHLIGCANGTDALQIALMALDLQPGDEVITPSFTYVATVEVISLLNLKPVYVEVDIDTFNIDPKAVEAAITEKTKAIIPVHLYGQTAEMAPLLELAQRHDLAIVEDAAQAIGSEYIFPDGRTMKAGTIGDIGCISFYPSKNLGACGDAGAIATNEDKLGEFIQMIVNHGQSARYYHDVVGVNSRLDSVQAAILDIKLRYLDQYNENRRQAANTYDSLLSEVEEVIIPKRAPFSKHVFHQYTLRVKAGREARDAMQLFLKEQGIPSMIYYPVSNHLQKAYQKYGYTEGDLPVTEQLSAEVISLPMHSELTKDQQEFIVSNIKEAIVKV